MSCEMTMTFSLLLSLAYEAQSKLFSFFSSRPSPLCSLALSTSFSSSPVEHALFCLNNLSKQLEDLEGFTSFCLRSDDPFRIGAKTEILLFWSTL